MHSEKAISGATNAPEMITSVVKQKDVSILPTIWFTHIVSPERLEGSLFGFIWERKPS